MRPTTRRAPQSPSAWQLLRREGPVRFGLRVARRLDVYRRFVLVGGTLRRRPRKARVAVEFARLEPRQIDEYLTLRTDQKRADVERRLAEGQLCCVGRVDDRAVVANWSCFERVWLPYLDCELRLGADVAYLHDIYVAPDCRGLRLADAADDFRRGLLRERGCETGVAVYEPENRVVIDRSKRERNVVVGWLSCLRLGPWRRLHLSLEDDAEGWLSLPGEGWSTVRRR